MVLQTKYIVNFQKANIMVFITYVLKYTIIIIIKGTKLKVHYSLRKLLSEYVLVFYRCNYVNMSWVDLKDIVLFAILKTDRNKFLTRLKG